MGTKNIALFASGAGSNARNIIDYFSDKPTANVSLIVTNNIAAGIVGIATEYNIPIEILTKRADYESNHIGELLQKNKIDLIVLGGFLLKIPDSLINLYLNRIINIHPSLLPKYGGKGMYGDFVHKAVKENREPETGVTIHLVNEQYDEGEILFQASCQILPEDSVEQIGNKVRQLEQKYFPAIIEKFVLNGI